jgi:enoyl-CoA hydratase/carnithine racemase
MEERLRRERAVLAEEIEAAEGELLATLRAGVATVTLNRPAALNALTFAMIEGLATWLDAWEHDERVRVIVFRGAGEKAFCAGGDIRSLYERITSGSGGHERYFAIEYALDYRIHRYPKPIVAVMDGIVMGGGMGIAQGAALRIVGDRTRLAMPETRIGIFPDVGGSYFLSRLPGAIGLYLGLAGPTIGAGDAVYCGLADAYLAHDSLGQLDGALEVAAGSRDARAALRAIAERTACAAPGEPELPGLRAAIDAHFGKPGVAAIVASLEAEDREQFRPWAAKTLAALARNSPTLLRVSHEQIRRGATLSLADCLRMELNLIHGCFEQGDFIEGIRALVVDKDNAPRWKPPLLAQVTDEAVTRFFAPRWPPESHPLAALEPRVAVSR